MAVNIQNRIATVPKKMRSETAGTLKSWCRKERKLSKKTGKTCETVRAREKIIKMGLDIRESWSTWYKRAHQREYEDIMLAKPSSSDMSDDDWLRKCVADKEHQKYMDEREINWW